MSSQWWKPPVKIVILTQYYPPELGAPQGRLSDLARRLLADGHVPIVLTAMPNYPTGRIFEASCMTLFLFAFKSRAVGCSMY